MIRISIAQIFIGFIGLMIAISTFCLMRYPRFRRPQFRESGAFSIGKSLLGASVVLLIIALMMLVQGIWEGTL
jgi:hypothetical protein